MKETIRDLSEFIRLKICVFICAIGASGFLLFNSLSVNLIFVVLTSFFGVAGAYSYNNMRDKEEDVINREKINPFTSGKKGLLIVSFCFAMGFFFSLFLPVYSIIFYSFGVIISIAYSFFRIKKYFLIKNLYTGFFASLIFLIGAADILAEIIQYYFLISFFIFIVSIISDLRDYKGDMVADVKTLPVFLGYQKARIIVFLLLVLFSLLIIKSYFIILLPFSLIITSLIYKNKPSFAHSIGGFSFVFLALFLFIGDI